jgi:DNA polymerase bacteriophage-type
MALIGIDFETRSEVDLTKHGRVNYLNGKLADIICMGYKINDESTKLWVPGDPLPDFVKEPWEHEFYAFNAQFDFAVWVMLGPKYKFNFMNLSQWTDVMALCGRFTYHQSLAKAGEDLNLEVQKNPRGKALIKLICNPPFNYSHIDLMELHEYCKRDVDTMYEMLNALPASKLSKSEQKHWERIVRKNIYGLPIDVKSAKQIYKVTEAYKEEQNQLLPDLTNGEVTKATQNQRIVKWLKAKGLITPNLQADTVIKLLNRLDLPDDVRTVLELRQELGRSSTAKYLKIIELEHKNRIHDNVRYYGANTGRDSGMGFQLYNLPRSKVGEESETEADELIQSFFDLSIIEKNPVKTAKELVRAMIKAPKGKLICAVDFTGIENRGLAWLSQDEKTLQLFEDGLDQYIDMAVDLYKIPYGDIDSQQRYFGKQLVLGCGYGLGWNGFVAYAEARDLLVTPEQAQVAVNAWRTKYHKTVRLWYKCKDAAINAITYPGTSFNASYAKYKVVSDRNKTRWLQLTLPSGRNMYYNKPLIKEGKFGPEPSAFGINPYTKKWMRLSIIPGRLVENIVQAMSRDILFHGEEALEKKGYTIVGSVYDEVIMEVPEDCDKKATLKDIYDTICEGPIWAKGLPLGAEGFIEKRYRKM